jgi:hypothetical protein
MVGNRALINAAESKEEHCVQTTYVVVAMGGVVILLNIVAMTDLASLTAKAGLAGHAKLGILLGSIKSP